MHGVRVSTEGFCSLRQLVCRRGKTSEIGTYTAPARSRAAKVHATRHFTNIVVFTVLSVCNTLTVLAAHGVSIAVGRTSLKAVVRSVSTNPFWTAAAVDSQLYHDVKGYEQMLDSPVISTRAVLAIQRTTAALQQRAGRAARPVGGDTSRMLSSIRGILVVLLQTLDRVLGELEIDGARWSLGRVLMSWVQGDHLGPFRCFGYLE